jgi:hypothetical protein
VADQRTLSATTDPKTVENQRLSWSEIMALVGYSRELSRNKLHC